MADAAAPPRIKALFLDFDSTISTPTFLKRAEKWAVADNLELFQSMSEPEILANFGGQKRIEELAALLTAMVRCDVRLHIVSIGRKAAIVPHLRVAGLLHFFGEERIWGQDCVELSSIGFVKARLIQQIMRSYQWTHDDALFVDDSKEHIDKCVAASVCRTLLVDKAVCGGMGPAEFTTIRQAAGDTGA
jgi:hypothetical protein